MPTSPLQVMYEEDDRLRIHESLDLFGTWANNNQFAKIPIKLVRQTEPISNQLAIN